MIFVLWLLSSKITLYSNIQYAFRHDWQRGLRLFISLTHTVHRHCSSLPACLSFPSPRTQQLCADVSFLLHYTLTTHPGGHQVCVCVRVFPLESFQVPQCNPADQTSRRKAQCFSAPSAAVAASLLWAGAKAGRPPINSPVFKLLRVISPRVESALIWARWIQEVPYKNAPTLYASF